jgi:hypothetical protein
MIQNITSIEKIEQLIAQGKGDQVTEALGLISNPIQAICTSCYIELIENGDAVDPDAISIVTDQDACEFDHEA